MAYDILFGASGGADLPAPADFDGDGKDDIATFRPASDRLPGAAEWFVLPSRPNPGYRTRLDAFSVAFGAAGNADQPVLVDFNGDGRVEITTFRSVDDQAPGRSHWFVLPSRGRAGYATASSVEFGLSGNVAAVADYDGDRVPDLAVLEPETSTWVVRRSGDGRSETIIFGASGRSVVPVLSPLFFRLRAAGIRA